jgi:hypothetical protein
MKYNISSMEVRISDLGLGDEVFDDENIIGRVINVGQTFLHKHEFIVIKYEYIGGLGRLILDQRKYYLHSDGDQKVQRICFEKIKKKSGSGQKK